MSDSPACPRCGAALPAAGAACVACALGLALEPEPASGDVKVVRYLGDYELLKEIASGGAATVWRARQRSLNREVAVKVLHGGALAGPAAVARFRFEAESVARLDHPGIVPIHEVGEHEGCPYFSMRYLPGGSLAEARGRFAGRPRAAAALLAKVARAVHHAHQHGVIHRDLKPGNILLDAADEPLVGDFGLARQLATDAGLTATTQIVGTPAYMSPEQARGKGVSTATDVWSLGMILHELLAGRPPFTGTPLEIIEKVRLAQVPPLPAGVPRDLANVALKCLRPEPAARYDTAKELADDLEAWLAGRPVRARPVSRLVRGWMWVRRHPWQVAVLLLLPLPFAVAGWYIAYLNWLAAPYEYERWVDGVMTLPVQDLPKLRCTRNLEALPLWGRTTWLRLEITNAPPELADAVKVRLFGDIAAWPDRERSGVLTNGQVFALTLEPYNKFKAERNLYFQEAGGWQAPLLLSNAPGATLVLRRVPPPDSR
jgi:hypothetical protein